MSIIERKTTPELAAAPVVTKREALGVFARPADKPGWKSWLTTVDHKKIGILYGATALFFFVVGGCEALLIRLQLARPNGTVLSAQTYNEMFT
ncbi:MAG: cytochrome ubiquinol oxidase subunit I, partial [Acidimicrobiia bacterium]